MMLQVTGDRIELRCRQQPLNSVRHVMMSDAVRRTGIYVLLAVTRITKMSADADAEQADVGLVRFSSLCQSIC